MTQFTRVEESYSHDSVGIPPKPRIFYSRAVIFPAKMVGLLFSTAYQNRSRAASLTNEILLTLFDYFL